MRVSDFIYIFPLSLENPNTRTKKEPLERTAVHDLGNGGMDSSKFCGKHILLITTIITNIYDALTLCRHCSKHFMSLALYCFIKI